VIATILALAVCHVGGHAPYVTPDNACTGGAYHRLTVAQVCTSKDRPYLPVAERRAILTNYGVPGWTGASGEIDHRVPFYLGGTTDRRNLWPQVGSIPNVKDRLENYTRVRVCVRHTMRVRTAIRIFLSDWTQAYDAYFGTEIAHG
jgi:hypothetical protein